MDEAKIVTNTDSRVCKTLDDLYAPSTRRMIFRLAPDFFIKHKTTATEAMHRADMLRKLEDSGVYIQHAVQKVALSRAAADGTPVVQTIKELNQLISDAYARIFNDRRDNAFAETAAGDFASLAERLAAEPDADYRLNGSLAMYLRDSAGWNEKLARLIRLIATDPPPSPGGKLLHAAVDALIAEIVAIPAAMQDIVGIREHFGDTIQKMLELFCGDEATAQFASGQELSFLAGKFVEGKLPRAHRGLACNIIAELLGQNRLRQTSCDEDMRQFKRIADLMNRAIEAGMPAQKAMSALENRAARFVEPEPLSRCLSAMSLPDQKVAWLLFAADCLVGQHCKLTLFHAIVRVILSGRFAQQFRAKNVPILKRLHRLAELSTMTLHNRLEKKQQGKIVYLLDTVAAEVATMERLFASIDEQKNSMSEKVSLLIKLISVGTFTGPAVIGQARAAIVGYLARPGFLSDYIVHIKRTNGVTLDHQTAKSSLANAIRRIGINTDQIAGAA